MKLEVLLFFLLTTVVHVDGQNLVPNPSFELYNNCPNNFQSISYSPTYTLFTTVTDWVNPVANTTPDYFNACGNNISPTGVPNSYAGYQDAQQGNGYIGLIAYYGSNSCQQEYREYVESKLLQPLISGHKYYVSFYSNLATVECKYAVDQIGMYFSTSQVNEPTNFYLSLIPQVKKSGYYIDDTINWIKIDTTFIASGNEQWLTIGKFCDGQSVYPITIIPNSQFDISYIFVDNVCVLDVSLPSNANTSDTGICINTFPTSITGRPINGSYLWSTGERSVSISITSPGIYWRETYGDCTFYIDTIKVLQRSLNKLEIVGGGQFCYGETAHLVSNYDYDSYLWSGGEITKSIGTVNDGPFILTVRDECGQQFDTAYILHKLPVSEPVVHDTSICQYTESAILTVIGSDSFRWYENFNAAGSFAQPNINTVTPGKYILYVSQIIDNCESEKVDVEIEVLEIPKPNLGSDTTICRKNGIELGENAIRETAYLWNTGQNESHIRVEESGLYVLTTTNICGSATDSTIISIEECDNCIYMASGFTPNGDGKNDIVKSISKCVLKSFSLQIANRWGEIVFYTTDINEGWDGKYSGENADVGTYYYSVSFQSSVAGAQKKYIKGDIILIR